MDIQKTSENKFTATETTLTDNQIVTADIEPLKTDNDSSDNVADETDNENEQEWISDYGITIMPNDFNVSTLYNLIKRGKIEIPNFQRNFVWDKKQSSKLIESFILGLPVPQIYLYQDENNNLKVIDGLQRLLTLFFFISGRFPRKNARTLLNKNTYIDEKDLINRDNFTDFYLDLPQKEKNKTNNTNPLHNKCFKELDFELNGANVRDKLEMTTVRTIIIKQYSPKEENPSSMFEIFNRLNTSGTKLNAQEIRMSLYYSQFFDMVIELNNDTNWRKVFGTEYPDSRMKDIELIFRAFALATESAKSISSDNLNYKPSMSSFINSFCCTAKKFDQNTIDLYKSIFLAFSQDASQYDKILLNDKGKFTAAYFDAIFSACTENAFLHNDVSKIIKINEKNIKELKNNNEFISTSLENTASVKNVKTRLRLAREFIRHE